MSAKQISIKSDHNQATEDRRQTAKQQTKHNSQKKSLLSLREPKT